MELSRPPDKSTEALRALDGEFAQRYETIMTSEALRPDARQKHLDELRREYFERWTLAADAAKRDLEEWTEIYQSRAESAQQPKVPEDKDARILLAVERQGLQGRIQRAQGQSNSGTEPDRVQRENIARLVGEYERLVRDGKHVLAHELEEALPALLSGDGRAEFERRAQENRLARMSEEDKKRVAEYEEWQRQASAVAVGLAHQDANRQRGYTPAPITPTTLLTHRRGGGRPDEIDEIPNPRYRDYGDDRPSVSQPQGGVIVPDPGSRG